MMQFKETGYSKYADHNMIFILKVAEKITRPADRIRILPNFCLYSKLAWSSQLVVRCKIR
jgi:hypothetical protein